MDKPNSEENQPGILSPEPIRPPRFLMKTNTNPFEEASTVVSLNDQLEIESLCSELNFILSSAISFPTSKSLPSPLFARPFEKYPIRNKVNPIIHDEIFLRFDRQD